jgi:hypothetical protein
MAFENSSKNLSFQESMDENPDSFLNFINKSDIITCYQVRNKYTSAGRRSHKQKNPFTNNLIHHTEMDIPNPKLLTFNNSQNLKTVVLNDRFHDDDFEEFSYDDESEDGADSYSDEEAEEEVSEDKSPFRCSENTYDLSFINNAQITPKKVNSDINQGF